MNKLNILKTIVYSNVLLFFGTFTSLTPETFKDDLEVQFKKAFTKDRGFLYWVAVAGAFFLSPSFIALYEGTSMIAKIPAVISAIIASVCLLGVVLYPLLIFTWVVIHRVLPHKEKRAEYIYKKNARASYMECLGDARYSQSTLNQKEFLSNFLVQWKKDTLKEPLLEHFNKNSPGFTRFCAHRFFISVKMQAVTYSHFESRNDTLIILSMLIPRRKTMRADLLQKIMINLQNIDPAGRFALRLVSLIPNLNAQEFFSNERISKSFSLYSDDLLSDVLSRSLNLEDFLTIIKYALASTEPFPVINGHVSDLAHYCLTQRPSVLLHKRLELMPTKLQDYEFFLVKSSADLVKVGSDFFNCLRHQTSNKTDIVAVYRNQIPIACASFKDGRVIELKGPCNIELFKEETKLILDHIRPYLDF